MARATLSPTSVTIQAKAAAMGEGNEICYPNLDCVPALMQVKIALEQQNGAPASDEEVVTDLLSKETVTKDTIRAAIASAKQAADEAAAAAAEAAIAAEQAAATEQETAPADEAAVE